MLHVRLRGFSNSLFSFRFCGCTRKVNLTSQVKFERKMSEVDLLVSLSPLSLTSLAVTSLVAIVCISSKVLFGTYSPLKANEIYQQRKKLGEKYDNLCTSRENMLFHISWAKSRGDNDEAKGMIKSLVALDKVFHGVVNGQYLNKAKIFHLIILLGN